MSKSNTASMAATRLSGVSAPLRGQSGLTSAASVYARFWDATRPPTKKPPPERGFSRRVEAAGIEHGDDIIANEDQLCSCEKCQECRAANALHGNCSTGRYLASLDPDLQSLIASWGSLDEASKGRLIVALADL